jgi:hypothetical protein
MDFLGAGSTLLAAERVSDKTIKRERLASFPRFERIRHDGLCHRLEATPSNSLKNTSQKQNRQCRRDTAKKACGGEDRDAEQKEILTTYDARCHAPNGRMMALETR